MKGWVLDQRTKFTNLKCNVAIHKDTKILLYFIMSNFKILCLVNGQQKPKFYIKLKVLINRMMFTECCLIQCRHRVHPYWLYLWPGQTHILLAIGPTFEMSPIKWVNQCFHQIHHLWRTDLQAISTMDSFGLIYDKDSNNKKWVPYIFLFNYS